MLGRSLESLVQLDYPSYEIVVVDNATEDSEAEEVAGRAGARYLREPRPGLSRARNAGVEAAGGELIAFIDDDAVAEQEWLHRHADALTDPAVGATTGRILPMSSHSSPESQLLDVGDAPLRVDRSNPHWFELTNFGGLGFGGNMVFKRAVFESGMRFRESLGVGAPLGGAEELFAFFEIVRDGHAIFYLPQAVVRHESPIDALPWRGRLAGTRRYSAYLCLLLVEEPEFRRRTLRHIAEALSHRPRPWRRPPDDSGRAPRWRVLAEAARGPALYLRSRSHER